MKTLLGLNRQYYGVLWKKSGVVAKVLERFPGVLIWHKFTNLNLSKCNKYVNKWITFKYFPNKLNIYYHTFMIAILLRKLNNIWRTQNCDNDNWNYILSLKAAYSARTADVIWKSYQLSFVYILSTLEILKSEQTFRIWKYFWKFGLIKII